MTHETIEQTAARMVEDMLDYHEHPMLKPGCILGTFHDGVWICYDNDSCNMAEWKKLINVLPCEPWNE